MIRLDKMLANLGIGSRKEVKKLIRQKVIYVNGELIKDDDYKVDEVNDVVTLNGEQINYQAQVYIMLNKPSGYVSANEDQNDPTVFDLIDNHTKGLFCVGRLDKDTEGLLLITNDGKLAYRLLNPKKEVYKKYFVETLEAIRLEDVELLSNGSIMLDEDLLQTAKVEVVDDYHLYLSIKEGKYHQVKRMLNACQNEVIYLKRIEMASLVLDPSLALGQSRHLTEDEVALLKSL